MKYLFPLSFLVLFSCTGNLPDQAKLRDEIVQAEKAFAQMAADSGIAKAFIFFAADSAVLLRGDKLVKGVNGIRDYMNKSPDSGVKLEWIPDFVDVSASGDLGYSYGKYSYSETDSSGVTQIAEGYFHTVWRRQADGRWKYVWD